jgi:hypothetical protein
MIRWKHGALMGLKEPIARKFILGAYKRNAIFDQSQRYIFPLIIKPRNLAKLQRKLQCKLQWLSRPIRDLGNNVGVVHHLFILGISTPCVRAVPLEPYT